MTRDEALAKSAQFRAWAALLGEEKVTAQAMLEEAKKLEVFAKARDDRN